MCQAGGPRQEVEGMGRMASEELNVVLAVAHGGLGEGIRDLLATVFESVVTVADEGSLRRCTALLNPDVVVVDIDLVRGHARRLVADLLAENPELPVLVLTTAREPVTTRAMREIGATGCVEKGRLGTDLIPMVERVLSLPA